MRSIILFVPQAPMNPREKVDNPPPYLQKIPLYFYLHYKKLKKPIKVSQKLKYEQVVGVGRI
jgi:hypothetical protein